MGFFNELLNNIEFKGGMSNVIIKTIIGIAGTAVVGSFVIGQLRIKHLDKLDDIEKLTKKNLEKTIKLEKKINKIDAKIGNVYVDGYEMFDEYRRFNKKQLHLIIDFNNENTDLLKKIIEINSNEKAIDFKSNINKKKSEKSIIVEEQKNK